LVAGGKSKDTSVDNNACEILSASAVHGTCHIVTREDFNPELDGSDPVGVGPDTLGAGTIWRWGHSQVAAYGIEGASRYAIAKFFHASCRSQSKDAAA
jgi:hypothetical protein